MGEEFDVKIPKALYYRIVRLTNELGVNDVNSFIIDLLREAVSRYEEEIGTSVVLSEEEMEKIKDRLKSLGYLD